MKKIILFLMPFTLIFCVNDKSQRTKEEPVRVGTSQQADISQGDFGTTKMRGVLTLAAQQRQASKGDNICMDITVADFNAITAMQYTMNWDEKALNFQKVQGFGLPWLNEQNFGAHRTEEGLLTFVWIDNSLRGVNVPDGNSIFQLCFKVAGSSGTKAYFTFTEDPTPFEVVNAKEELLQLNGIAGSVSIR